MSNGIKIINSVVNEFKKIVTKLEKGIACCSTQKDMDQASVTELQDSIKEQVTAMAQGQRLVAKLKELVEE